MKKITLLSFLLLSVVGFSQTVLEDFEGTAPTIAITNDGNGSVSIVADPATGGTRGNVLKLVTASGESWTQAELVMQGEHMDLRSSQTRTVSVDIYSTTPRTFMAKVVAGTSADSAGNSTAAHAGNGWDTIIFDFTVGQDNTSAANGIYSKIFFFPFRNTAGGSWNASSNDEFYFDNITAVGTPAPETCSDGIQNNGETAVDCGGPNCDACPVDPTTAPTAPIARNAWDVISFYSEAYTSIGLNNVSWDDGDAVTTTIAGNEVLKMQVGNFLGQSLGTAAMATNMTHFHMDYYITDDFAPGQVLNSKLSNHAGGMEINGVELNIALASGDVQVWKSYDVEIPAGAARENIVQFLITVSNTVKLAYLDNIYLYRAATASVDKNNLLNVSLSPVPAKNTLTISAKNIIDKVTIYNVLGKKVKSVMVNKMSDNIDVSSLTTGMYILKYSVNNTVGTMKFIKE